jgi:hypothetical protein
MIYYVATERFSSTIRRFLKNHGKTLGGILRSLTWEELFFERGGPIGHYIFTDFDRLSRYELECAAAFALALEKAAPEARILNHPLRVLERFPLLVALHKAGINDFTATRIEAGERPPKYPVFIRAEDGYGGPETDVLNNDAEFDTALADLARRGLPLRGRIAIGYAAERGADGFFSKYGAHFVDGRVIPNHLMRGRTWVVKSHVTESEWVERRDDIYRLSEPAVDDEMKYIRENPHDEVLRRAFGIAGIDFGRADYGVVGGRVQVYEINTNPSLPGRLKNDIRDERRAIIHRNITGALRVIATPLNHHGKVRFSETRPRAHSLHLPRRRLAVSVLRRASRFVRQLVARGPTRQEKDATH